MIAGVLDHRGGHRAVRATYDGQPGPPRAARAGGCSTASSELEGDEGARELLAARA